MERKWIILLVIVVFIFIAIYASFFLWIFLSSDMSNFIPGRQIVLIRIEGVISASGEGEGFLSGAGTSSEDIINQLRRADRDSSVRAILLRIDSPGGTAAASEEIYIEVKRTKKPVIASIADIGSSGAYLIACGADKIVANSSSSVGSIGTILTIPNFQKLFKKLGVDYVIITQGKYKSLGHPARPITEEEKKILEEQSKVVYDQFIENVAESRKLSREEVKDFANGLSFPGKQALKMGLIDKIGNYQDAVDVSAKMGKIKGEPVIVEYAAPSLSKWLSQIFQGKGAELYSILAPRYLQFPLQQPILR
jgi:protease-4